MERFFSVAIFLFLLLSCESPEPENTPVVPPDPTGPVTVLLSADGVTDTYALIASKGYGNEAPDASHSAFGQHIRQIWDAALGKYVFAFYLHLTPDDDRGESVDRQRNEIKTWDQSPANMIATKGQTHTYKWKFCLPSGFQPSGEFSHIHQIKPVALASGGDEIPMITLTARKKSAGNKLQLIYRAPRVGTTESVNSYLAEIDLGDFPGQWVEVTETVTYDTPSSYSIIIRRLGDSKQLLNYASSSLVLWRTDTKFTRPKYGLYRKTSSGDQAVEGLRDEVVLFADFALTEE